MKDIKRSLRRHHVERLKKTRSTYYNGYAKNNPAELGAIVQTATLCSCPLCGNPRKHFGIVSIQEQKEAWFQNDREFLLLQQ